MALAKSASGPGDPYIASRLVAELFAGYEEDDRLTVLDLGPSNAATVNFLSRFKARIFFADLLDNPALNSILADPDPPPMEEIIAAQISLPEDVQIDICLLWDHLHYFDLTIIEALSTVLQPHFHKTTRGYGFGTLHASKPDDANQYGIADIDSLVALPIESEPPFMAHSQQRIGEHFAALRISRATLLREGRLELLFEAP